MPNPPQSRFHYSGAFIRPNDGLGWHLYDADTRRVVQVVMPPAPNPPPEDDPDLEIPLAKAIEILAQNIDSLVPDAMRVTVGESGDILSVSTDPAEDLTLEVEYPHIAEYQLPAHVKTVLRSDLTELSRLSPCVDVVSSSPPSSPREEKLVFKYSKGTAVYAIWTEIQMLARLPPYPNILALDRVVLDETTGSRVVGFTMPFISHGTINQRRPSVFKLKWLKQLMKVADTLNLEHGIIHQDIADRNVFIDPDTDSILVFDFNTAARIGVHMTGLRDKERQADGRDDVKGIIFLLYQQITRDPAYDFYYLPLVNEEDIEDPEKWIKHPDVQLDHSVRDFYLELMSWARGRRALPPMSHYTEAPKPLQWPDCPDELEYYTHNSRRKEGGPILNWRRPASARLEPGRRLLATGRYADEEGKANDSPATAGRASKDGAEAGKVATTPGRAMLTPGLVGRGVGLGKEQG